MTSSDEAVRPRELSSASRRTTMRPDSKPGPSKLVRRNSRPSTVAAPVSGSRRPAGSGSVEASGPAGPLTTTWAPVTRAARRAYSSAPATDAISSPAGRFASSTKRVRAGAIPSPLPDSKRPALVRRRTTRRARAVRTTTSSRARILSRSPPWMAAASSRSPPIARPATWARSWNSRNSPEAERCAVLSRALILPSSESLASTKPTAATTIIGRMTRTMKKMVSRLRKLNWAPDSGPA